MGTRHAMDASTAATLPGQMSAHVVGRRRFITLTGMALGVAPFHALACRPLPMGEWKDPPRR